MIPVPPAIVWQVDDSVDAAAFLAAVRMREGDWANPYGLSSSTRAQHRLEVKEPTEIALAIRHFRWIVWRLGENHVRATPYNIALCWNQGMTGGLRIISGKRRSVAAEDYADCVNNLYMVGHKQL